MSSIDRIKKSFEGKTIALVGGDERPWHQARLEKAFGLKRVLWVETRDSDASPRRFASVIHRRDVFLVVALTGLLRHQHARDLRDLCRALKRPLVVYWRSPHPEGLAEAIVRQCPSI